VPGEVYNICAGQGRSMKELLDMMISISAKFIEIRADPERLRAADKAVLLGDCSKLNELGWKPQVQIRKTISEILNYWRE